MGAFEGRSGGTGGRDEFFVVPQDQLSVCADIDDEDLLSLSVGPFSDQNPHVIGTHKAGFNGQEVNISRGMNLQPEISCLHVHRLMKSGREGGYPQIFRIDLQEEMVHDRVAHHRKVENMLRGESDSPGHGPNQPIQSLDDRAVKLLESVGMGHDVTDSRHDILSIDDLRIHHGFGGDQLSTYEMAEIRGHSRCADINSKTVSILHLPGYDVEDLPSHPGGHSDLPVPLPQDNREL